MRSALILLAMTFVALPIIPDDPVGPFGGVNPREIWMIAIVLAGVSFAGYVAVKVLGATARHAARGRSRRARILDGGYRLECAPRGGRRGLAAAAGGGCRDRDRDILCARAGGFRRAEARTASLSRRRRLLTAMLIAAAFAAIAAFWRRGGEDTPQEVTFRNPFGFWSVVGFALLLGAIVLAGRALGESLGAAGAIAGALALGLADVDAVTVSMTRLTPQPLSLPDAALAILAAVASNNVAKTVIGVVAGRGDLCNRDCRIDVLVPGRGRSGLLAGHFRQRRLNPN